MNSNSLRLLCFLFFMGSIFSLHANNNNENPLLDAEFSNSFAAPFFGDTLIVQDSFNLFITDCEAGANICIGVPLAEANNYQITVDGQPYSGGLAGCDFDTISVYSYATLNPTGPYMLTSWTVNGTTFSGQFTDIPALVDSMNLWDPMGNWLEDSVAKFIEGGNSANTYSDMNILVLMNSSTAILGYNSGVEAKGMQLNFDVGIQEVIMTHNSNGCIDTFIVTVICTSPEMINRTVDVGSSGTYCIDFSQLLGAPDTVYNYCPDENNTNVNFDLINSNTCVEYTGVNAGRDTACIVACDGLGVCDTTFIFAEVNTPGGGSQNVIDEIFVGTQKTVCLNQAVFSSALDTIYNICEGAGGTHTNFVLDTMTYCVTYTGATVGGLDSICYVLCDSLGTCDTTNFIINVLDLPGGSRDVIEEVFVTQSEQYCMDTTVLTGVIDTIYNACPDSSGTFVNFVIDTITYCVTYTGVSMGGSEKGCFVICDDLGACDTTNIIVTAIMPQGGTRIIYDTLYVNTSDTICIDTTAFAGLVDTIFNDCPSSSGTFATVVVDPNTYCISINATSVGSQDTACILVQSELGNMDTTLVYLTVKSPEPDTIIETVLIGDTETVCLDTTQLGGMITAVVNDCAGSSGSLVSFSIDTMGLCISYTGGVVGKQDTACFILTDAMGVSDTTVFIVEVVPPTPEIIYDTIVPSQIGTHCIDTSELLLPVDTIYNICQIDADTNAVFTLDSTNWCVSYTGLKPNGSDTLCYVICNDRGVCDTSYLYIHVRDVVLTPTTLYDTIVVNNSKTICFEQDELPTPIDSIANFCPSSSGEFVTFIPNNNLFCLAYQGLDVGTDTACMVLIDELGFQDTVTVIVTVTLPQPETVLDTLLINASNTYCVDTTELSGIIDTMYNICESNSGTSTNFTLNMQTFCIDAQSIAEGTDSACIVICDDLGTCDTTYYYISTMPDNLSMAPVAVDDRDTTTETTIVVINALGNDTIPIGSDPSFTIITTPNNGIAVADPLGTISYTPDANFCGATDSLEYEICNTSGCDTALVVIYVECNDTGNELTVYDGFSPNGDGIADVFTIRNIEKYPSHKLYIYNRWGNLVFENQLVTDKWDGRWEGKDVPDGVYFYLLDDGEGNELSGYLYLRR